MTLPLGYFPNKHPAEKGEKGVEKRQMGKQATVERALLVLIEDYLP